MNLVAHIRRALFGPSRPQSPDFYHLAKRAARVPSGEMAVAEAALADGGAVASRLLRQLREARDVWRLVADGGGYELRISTTDDLTVQDIPRDGWTSDWIPVVSLGDARTLEVRLVVLDSGIVELLGRTLDGRPWPPDWQARPTDLDAIRAKGPWLDLPTPTELRVARASAAETIATWLGAEEVMQGRRGVVRADPPATDDTISGFAAREGFALPEAYDTLLRHADGIEVGRWLVLGTRDAYRLDMPGPRRLVIAPPNEDGALTIAESGQVVWVALGDRTTEGRVVAPNLRQWLQGNLTRSARSTSGRAT